jgi:hypothetical protein
MKNGFTKRKLGVSKMADIDKALERIERGDAWGKRDEVVQIEAKRPLDKVIPIRLSADKWEELRQEAREMGIGPTTLARMWIMERLRKQQSTYLAEKVRAQEEMISHYRQTIKEEFAKKKEKV